MLLTIDIGNTTISFGLIKGRRIIFVDSLKKGKGAKSPKARIERILKKIHAQYPKVKDVMICSVVPELINPMSAASKKFLKIKPIIIGRDIKVPIKNNYRNPRQVGQDRLVGAFAAKSLYGNPVIIVDFGTAITFDLVSDKGDYEGGMIVPGIRLSTESLFEKTALLPEVKGVQKPTLLIGKDTKGSIASGIFYGYGTMCAGLVDLISKKIRKKPKVIVTGGDASLMTKGFLRKIDKVDQHLVFKGMDLLYGLME